MKIRKFIQIQTDLVQNGTIATTALADDGTIWASNNHGIWLHIGQVPQVKEPEYMQSYKNNSEEIAEFITECEKCGEKNG